MSVLFIVLAVYLLSTVISITLMKIHKMYGWSFLVFGDRSTDEAMSIALTPLMNTFALLAILVGSLFGLLMNTFSLLAILVGSLFGLLMSVHESSKSLLIKKLNL
jgi:hypothetical protein